MKARERIVEYDCRGERVYGVIHEPEVPQERGILMLDRVGVHRQTLLWGRLFAERGIPVMRFDLRGRGDSEGRVVTVEETGDDMRTATNGFFASVSQLKEIVVLGISQGASVSMMYAPNDPRVCGVVMGNPWIRVSDQELARRYLLNHLARIFTRDFWWRILFSEAGIRGAARSFLNLLKRSAVGTGRTHEQKAASQLAATMARGVYELPTEEDSPLRERLVMMLQKFRGQILLILSGGDPAAAAFASAMRAIPQWSDLLHSGKISLQQMPDANHLFSSREWRQTFAALVVDWLATF